MAREEVKSLRDERDRLKAGVQQQLGHQVDTISWSNRSTNSPPRTGPLNA